MKQLYVNYTESDTDKQAGPFHGMECAYNHLTRLERNNAIRATYVSDFRNERRTLVPLEGA